MNSPHPVQERDELDTTTRIRVLEQLVARLWDQLWWVCLPPEKRAEYEAEGYRAPIERFYNDSEE